jgi:hypothetical protein
MRDVTEERGTRARGSRALVTDLLQGSSKSLAAATPQPIEREGSRPSNTSAAKPTR